MSSDGHGSFYAQWRAARLPLLLAEGEPDGPPEKWLQLLWQQQRLERARLHLTDGRRVRVLHPGFWNHEAGPDFRRALIQFEGQPPISGDVEIDLQTGGWQSHGHERNPAYAGVILHVVWHAPRSLPAKPAAPPLLVLRDFLDAPLEELAPWLGGETPPDLPEDQAGRCAGAWRELESSQREALLGQAALVRLHGKALQLQRRARAAGWEQALWEAAFRALGYKHNTWPMLNLGELRPRLADGAQGALHWQARLLGAGGLLPEDLHGCRGAGSQTRRLWDLWWRDRDALSDCLLPASVWRLGGLRPANHPHRRLALASHWLANPLWRDRLEEWFAAEMAPRAMVGSFLLLLAVRDEFWDWHWSLRSNRLPRLQPLLGAQRATDLAVNVVLPWYYAQALERRDEARRRRAETRYLCWPAGEDNAVLKLARQRMLGGSAAVRLRTAAAQQGLLQIVRDCCDHANALCEPCWFPDLVRQFKAARPDAARTLAT